MLYIVATGEGIFDISTKVFIDSVWDSLELAEKQAKKVEKELKELLFEDWDAPVARDIYILEVAENSKDHVVCISQNLFQS